MYDISVRHEGLGTFLETHIKVVREDGLICNAGNQWYEIAVAKHATAAAFAELPGVKRFLAERARLAGIESELHKVGLEKRQAERDREKVLDVAIPAFVSEHEADRYAVELSDANTRITAAAGRLLAAQDGARTFRESLLAAETDAKAEMMKHFHSELAAKIIADRLNADNFARHRLELAIRFVIDELYALDQAVPLVANAQGIEDQIEQVLREMASAAKQ